MAFTLPPLPYDFAALEPHIDAKTMEIHHGKHHQTYVNNLNAAIEKAPELASKSLDDLMRNASKLPEAVRTAVRNNGGGHWNHSMFWQIMAPKAGGEPGGNLGTAIKSAFGDFAKFREQFGAAGVGRFGSGWAWLINNGGKLSITSTPTSRRGGTSSTGRKSRRDSRRKARGASTGTPSPKGGRWETWSEAQWGAVMLCLGGVTRL